MTDIHLFLFFLFLVLMLLFVHVKRLGYIIFCQYGHFSKKYLLLNVFNQLPLIGDGGNMQKIYVLKKYGFYIVKIKKIFNKNIFFFKYLNEDEDELFGFSKHGFNSKSGYFNNKK